MQAPVAVVSCSAQKAASKVAAVAAAAAIAVAAPMVAPEEAFARDVQPYAGLTPCKKNKAFAKREKQELKALEKQLLNIIRMFFRFLHSPPETIDERACV